VYQELRLRLILSNETNKKKAKLSYSYRTYTKNKEIIYSLIADFAPVAHCDELYQTL